MTKTEVQLKMAGLEYCKRLALPPASPKGQMPYIEDDGEQIADSTFIRAHIEGKYGFDFDAGLSPLQRAQAWTVERMVEHHVYSALVAARWLDPENFARGPVHFFDAAPEQAREAVCTSAVARVAENYRIGGLGRHTPEEAVGLVARSLAALSQLLARKPLSDGCSGRAAPTPPMFGMVAGILTPFFESSLRRRAEQFENLNAYADRMMAQFYPELTHGRNRHARPEAACVFLGDNNAH